MATSRVAARLHGAAFPRAEAVLRRPVDRSGADRAVDPRRRPPNRPRSAAHGALARSSSSPLRAARRLRSRDRPRTARSRLCAADSRTARVSFRAQRVVARRRACALPACVTEAASARTSSAAWPTEPAAASTLRETGIRVARDAAQVVEASRRTRRGSPGTSVEFRRFIVSSALLAPGCESVSDTCFIDDSPSAITGCGSPGGASASSGLSSVAFTSRTRREPRHQVPLHRRARALPDRRGRDRRR